MKNKALFAQGFRDGMPIAMGYLSVSFAFGMLAREAGLHAGVAVITSLTSVTGTGQFAGVEMLAKGISLTQIACTVLIINLRYLLMSLSLCQRLDPAMSIPQRLLVAFGNTDEIFAVAMSQNKILKLPYMLGLMTSPILGWGLGTLIGSVAGGLLPMAVRAALGIAIYAMFLAIVIPPARASKAVLVILLAGAGLNALLRYAPGLSSIPSGWAMIISGIAGAALGAWRFPAMQEVCDDDR